MKKHFFFTIISCLFFISTLAAQNLILEGYIFEDNNRGYLNEAQVLVYEANSNVLVIEVFTNEEGFFTTSLAPDKDYVLKVSKDLFFKKEESVSTKGKKEGEKVFAKIKLERKPGYIFDVTLAESGAPTATVDAISGARIEVFNNTKREETMVIEKLNGINFDVTFERGNHYTVLIRKEGYFNKRLEAYVDVEGCILCFEGVGTVTPGVSDVMSRGFQMGSVLANIELEPARLDKTIRIDNIYYDLDKYDIRADAAIELDKVVKLLKDNPRIIIELGSHTDSRGGTRYNKKLSSQRAEAAVDYIIKTGGISPTRITSKGYGETQLVNKCSDGVKCSKEEHQENRRTELKILGFEKQDAMTFRTLKEIVTEERLMREIESSGQIHIPAGEVSDFEKKVLPNANKSEKQINNAIPSEAVNKEIKKNTKSDKKEKKDNNSTGNNGQAVIIKSADVNLGETLVSGGAIESKAVNPEQMKQLTFGQNQVLLIQQGMYQLVPKMIGNQLNTKLTDLLKTKKIFMEEEGKMKTYQFDAVNQMPMPLLNVFLKKIAILEKNEDWQIFTMDKNEGVPVELIEALN
jgi:outer membrane protein OmpA-like peptidoglycan-associated protein